MESITTILVSAGVSLTVSIGAFLIQRYLNRRGKLKIRGTLNAPHIAWFRIARDASNHIQINVPISLDIYNTSHTTKVMRNVGMDLMLNGTTIASLSPVNMIAYQDPHEGRGIEKLGAETGVYSYAIPAQDISCIWMMFAYAVPENQLEKEFNEVRVSFIDYRDKRREFTAQHFGESIPLGQPKDLHKLGGAVFEASFR